MGNFLHDALLMIAAVSGWEFGKYIARRIQMPYRWSCKQCDFKLKTSNRETYEISKSSHNHLSTREYKT